MNDRVSGDIYCLVLVTAGSEMEAETIAFSIVNDRLAACASIHPIRSIYRWQGEVKKEPEWQIVFKTERARFEDIAVKVRELHSYELPEIISLSLDTCTDEYLHWLSGSLIALNKP
ncbi:MAG: Divalent-cation tolerance protein CutA [Chroococcopsis gigantea SAG 12.99]|jgi:periplasmic divalent cation tolerance protein|nr:divalent-cation tolerance protein CutA [Chlorogloea purpurea SAG 13.99]MDV3000497.1 Divalent-cation tolerance protein CutA [Chroococcopsis gigantea SAG 12.99]